jgi:hypothetical protein
MIKNKKSICDWREVILTRLNASNNKEGELRLIRVEIAELLKGMIIFYDTNGELGLWEKEYLARAITALSWDWLYLSLCEIDVASSDERSTSYSRPRDQKLIDEVVKLNAHDLERALGHVIAQFK